MSISTVASIFKQFEAEYINLWLFDALGNNLSLALHKDNYQDVLKKMYVELDIDSAFLDPFAIYRAVNIIGSNVNGDFRTSIKQLDNYAPMTSFIHCTLSFYIFDGVAFDIKPERAFFSISDDQFTINSGKESTDGISNLGYRGQVDRYMMQMQPFDYLLDLRSEICKVCVESGLRILKHHHGAGENQCVVTLSSATFAKLADDIAKFKYITRNIARAYSKSVTFMTTPLSNQANSTISLDIGINSKNSSKFDPYLKNLAKNLNFISAMLKPTINCYKQKNSAIFSNLNNDTFSIYNISSCINPYIAINYLLLCLSLNINSNVTEAIDLLSALQNLQEFAAARGDDAFIPEYAKLKLEELNAVRSVVTPQEFKLYYNY